MMNNSVLLSNIAAGYFLPQTIEGRTYIQELERRVELNKLDPEEASIARIKGRKKFCRQVLSNVAGGYSNLETNSGITFGQYLTSLVQDGFIDPEEANLVIIRGRNIKRYV